MGSGVGHRADGGDERGGSEQRRGGRMGKARAEGVGEKAERQEERHGEEEGGLRGGAGGHGLGFKAARRQRGAQCGVQILSGMEA